MPASLAFSYSRAQRNRGEVFAAQSPPTMAGTMVISNVLTVSPGTLGAIGGATLEYQWFRGREPIPGETAAAHTVVAADLRNNLSCAVQTTDPVNGMLVAIVYAPLVP